MSWPQSLDPFTVVIMLALVFLAISALIGWHGAHQEIGRVEMRHSAEREEERRVRLSAELGAQNPHNRRD